jgi:Asp-tRNA(Asn)/Glu-tRNA(Gln) amidotransferase A subunit family amidase
MRFALKDAIDVHGLETGAGSQCFREHYGKKTETAIFVDQLLKAGAVMVGKTRMCQFCDGQSVMER